MATHPTEGYADDFLEQILSIPSYSGSDSGLAGNDGNLVGTSMPLQLIPGDVSGHVAGGGFHRPMFPLGLSLDSGFPSPEPSQGGDDRANLERESAHYESLFPAFGHVHPHSVRVRPLVPQAHQAFHGQPTPGTVSAGLQPPAIRPRVRARRGQATDPHSIAERLRRERIAERFKALHELVPTCNKTDRAAMLDEIVDYVKFLRLQVKVLSMSRLGGASAVAPLVADVPLPSAEREGGSNQQAWDKWSNDETEQEVAKLMEEDVGAAMQFLQSKALCIMPISLAAAIYPTHQPDNPTLVKPEPNVPS